MKKPLKVAALVLLVTLAGIQFVRPERNRGEAEGPDSLVRTQEVPPGVRDALRRACYDCHSDRTSYPWYSEIQPVRWWLDSHINDGKRHLNFSAFARYDAERKSRALDEIVDTVAIAKSMPLESYTWMHREAVLTDAERTAIADWADSLNDEIEE
ncbi:MAG TPA: heme-binding domain-containing protein [Opitutaceae bacterium]|nr:heme-binding domain-containing protein [Opitutaceae bacterium]